MPASSEDMTLIHGSAAGIDGSAVLLIGPSGSGKSDLLLRLLDRGHSFIGDDQILLRRENVKLRAYAPATIAGKLEVRGVGVVEWPNVEGLPVSLIVSMLPSPLDEERLPEIGRLEYLGASLPHIGLYPFTISAPLKVELALQRIKGDGVSGLRACGG